MATTHTVVKGDTLWGIAEKYLGSGTKYKQLAAINNISNPDRICIGQVIKLSNTGGSSTTSTANNSNKPTIDQFGLLSNVENMLFATWSWNKSNTDGYKVSWTYDVGNGVWLSGNNTTNSVDEDDPSISRQSTYSIPEGARKVRFKVKPISKTYRKNDTETKYWEAEWSSVKTYTNSTPLDTPSTPSVEVENYILTASLDNIKINGATRIEFQVVKNNSASAFATKKAEIVSSHASHAFTVVAGGKYKVRCRAYNDVDKEYSDWTDYSAELGTIPETPSGITSIRANSETSVYLEWDKVETAEKYDIEYSTKKDYFDITDQTTKKTDIELTRYEVTGLESGSEYFFRIRAVNSAGESGWSGIKSVVIGRDPAAPTTWSSTTTAITGESLTLYWVHNAEDGSSQTYAELEIYIGESKETYTIQNSTDEDEKDKTSYYAIDTSDFKEGTKIQWRVRTAGVTKVYGEWSVQRTIDIYAPPTLELSMTDINSNDIETLESFPFYIYGLAGPKTQAPISYHLAITSNEIYETTDAVGNPKVVNAGEQVYSKYFDVNTELLVEFSAGNIDLENNVEYTVTCTVSMNSGLTAESTLSFIVSWTDAEYEPNAEIGVDMDTFSASIRPYCDDHRIVYQKVNFESGVYTITNEEIESSVWGEIVKDAKTTTGEQVYSGTTADDVEVFYCIVDKVTPVEDVFLSVYRREFDGSFIELAKNLDGAKRTTITDPHPALDYARYRVVATSKTTGNVSYYDVPGYPIGGKAVIIQWDEQWTNFETSEESALEQPPWSGSLLKLPYNVDVSDDRQPEVSLVKYAGRKRPISYYGTQLGETAGWSVAIDKHDKETLYALRRLSTWMGDVYVREPSGSGYWAQIVVSFDQKHCELTIPVSIKVTRVEGGI